MSLISTIISSSIPRSPKIDEIDASGSAVSDRSDNELFIRGNKSDSVKLGVFFIRTTIGSMADKITNTLLLETHSQFLNHTDCGRHLANGAKADQCLVVGGWWADHTIGIAQENMLQLALTHNEAFVSGRLTTTRGNNTEIIFLGLLTKWVEGLLHLLASSVIKTTMEKVKPELVSASWVPLLRLLFPKTETNAIGEIAKLLVSP
ncbi:hypothetical protein DKX38_016217 [Salix brachista]|uniref:Uncharacterized protein n=1 Tax=Salix brachista TaxID=2182728 RepID=A0A5N5L7C4_9ROSI|nr:hypothetical protein DKX38_016217 [Salix brachista]